MSEKKFICTACGTSFPIRKNISRCPKCHEPLEVEEFFSTEICAEETSDIFKRYKNFFPFKSCSDTFSLGEGMTPLLSSPSLSKKLGVHNVFLKNETVNSTWSFKDRGTASALRHAVELGFHRIGTVSTGNMAASVAAFGARANLETTILVKEDLPIEKLNPIAIYNARVVKVYGDYSLLYEESLRLGEKYGIYFMNSDVPFRVEGSKTIAFEICEQTKFNVPDVVIVPTSAGGNIRGIEKGFREFYKSGLIPHMPLIVAAQAEGCAPIVEAYKKNANSIERFPSPHTIAHAIENPFPPSGNQVLRVLSRQKGVAVAVPEKEILQAQRELAGTGLFVQPASAVSLAAIPILIERGIVTSNQQVACILTGSGLKYTAAFEAHKLTSEDVNIDSLEDCVRV